jgi:uncharacterized protein (TIGR02246 family)
MMRPSSALRLSPVTLLLACQQAATPAAPAGLTDVDRAAIESLHTEFAAAVVAGDFAKVASMYTDDASLMAPNAPVVTGRMAIQQALTTFPPMGEMKLLTHDVAGSSEVAAVRGTYAILMAPPGSPAISDTGSYAELWRKQADGKWLMAWDIWNSHKPAPTTH